MPVTSGVDASSSAYPALVFPTFYLTGAIVDKAALSDITVFNKYAKFLHTEGRRENWSEIVYRNMHMHQKKYPHIAGEIERIYERFVIPKKVLPSMRSLQFGGRPIELNEARGFNCAYLPAESHRFFGELMFLLLGGTGVGYSVQHHHVSQLPSVKEPKTINKYRYQVQDSIIGWADAVKIVAKAFFNGGNLPNFDYRDIRDKGTELVTTGGKAPGPEPLKICVDRMIGIFNKAIGRQLTGLNVHDLACSIADSVRAGGIRRAAMICLFDRLDTDLLTCKSNINTQLTYLSGELNQYGRREVGALDIYGQEVVLHLSQEELDHWVETNKLPWYYTAPTRARANNSAVLPRMTTTQEEFQVLMSIVEVSGCGEPGIFWTNNTDDGTNPCVEIALRAYQMCNLVEIHAGKITTQEEFNEAARAAAFLGTLQAGYTDFHYLNPRWKETCEEDALLGISMTGIASGTLENLSMEEAVQAAKETNKIIAHMLGINPAARLTCVKPAGTTSLVLGTSSGVHAWFAPYYIRRMRAGKDEELVQYLLQVAPELVEQDVTDPKQVVLSFPQKAPEGAITRDESMFDLLERVKRLNLEWVAPGHSIGSNKHNVSCTISVKPDEWPALTEWMWDNRTCYNGISVMPYFGSQAYAQMPFEEIDEARYLEMLPLLQKIDISHVFEQNGDGIDLAGELACAGGQCEVSFG